MELEIENLKVKITSEWLPEFLSSIKICRTIDEVKLTSEHLFAQITEIATQIRNGSVVLTADCNFNKVEFDSLDKETANEDAISAWLCDKKFEQAFDRRHTRDSTSRLSLIMEDEECSPCLSSPLYQEAQVQDFE
jgi:hypothetical protein